VQRSSAEAEWSPFTSNTMGEDDAERRACKETMASNQAFEKKASAAAAAVAAAFKHRNNLSGSLSCPLPEDERGGDEG